ncbi:hypothetical protein [Alkalicoccus urumqiensis]|uniref:Citrate transporter-like domain-containing protein n=1 Tax=Alkalicoccus urumqiensis TaxID=1548213 RepID=A0A2P6MKZ8_ALKUR|nr:hypothetical protein [Alkalicoccus urumqiensis]PRO66956.1 hypothetical protein C6I21_03265 [Alkalicoccus urumqiensis]
MITSRLYLLFTTVIALYLITIFVPIDALHYITAGLTLLLLLLSIQGASMLFRILALVFNGTAIVLLFTYDLWQTDVFLYPTENLSLLGLLFMLPWMNSVVRAGGYDRKINQLLSGNTPNLGSLYQRASAASYILVTFINLSALSLSQSVLKTNLKQMNQKLQQSFISETTLRAFAVALCWSPMEILIAISVDSTGVGYFTMLPWLMLISFLTLFLDMMIGKIRYRHLPYDPPPEARAGNTSVVKPVLILTAALTLFLLTIVVIGNVTGFDFILTVTLVIFPFAVIWSLFMKRFRRFLTIGFFTWRDRTNHMQNFILLFVSLAVFSTTLNETPVLDVIQRPFLAMESSTWIVLFMMQGTYLLMSMFGIHPIATIAVLIEAVSPLMEQAEPLSFALVFVSGALATATVGTYGVTVTMTSMNTHQNPYRITARNMPFAILYGSIGTITAILLL